ncbi:hypothetical protein DKX15_19270 [Enterococcus faecium]|nr:hypothetical protein DKX15_19270 [Enterococcus faecium]
MTGGVRSDACARLAMARLRHSLCAAHAGHFAGAPAPTGSVQLPRAAITQWERAFPRTVRRGQHFEMRDLQP